MTTGNFILRFSDSARTCAESVRETQKPSISSVKMVPATGLEPVRCYSLEPESSASANSATRAQPKFPESPSKLHGTPLRRKRAIVDLQGQSFGLELKERKQCETPLPNDNFRGDVGCSAGGPSAARPERRFALPRLASDYEGPQSAQCAVQRQ